MADKQAKCSCCGRKFLRGLKVYGVEYKDIQTKIKKKWKIGRSPTKIYLCEKCKNTAFALIRNNLALKTRDIIDE